MNKEETEEKQKCRVCGCTDEKACEGGCHWVAFDLCNVCQAWREEKSKNISN